MSAVSRPAHLARVFEALRGEGATARELVAETGLSRPTVMTLLAVLEGDGLVRPQDGESNAPGRPASTWSIAPDAGIVIGVDLLVGSALICTARLDGRVVTAELISDIPGASGARLEALTLLIERHIAAHTPLCGPLRAMSISTTGTVDDTGTVMESTAVPDWSGFDLGRRLSAAFGLPVRIENDVNASAYGEFVLRVAEGRLDHTDDLLLVTLSRSVLTGLVMGGRIHRGKGFNAGEIGLIVTEGAGPEKGHLSHAAEVIASAAAVLDPTVIVISVPMTRLPGAVGEISDHVRASRAVGATPLSFEGARLPGSGAAIGALSLALGDAHEAIFDRSPGTIIAPTALDLVQRAITKGRHLPLSSTNPEELAPLRVGVVGVGARARLAQHFELPENGGIITAACEPHPEGKQRILSRLGRDDIVLTRTVDELIGTGIDVALITSPDDTHAGAACALLEAGVPVYVEKPLAIHLDDATRILTTAHRTGTKLYVGHNMRHMDVVRGMRRIIQDGLIGEVKAIWCRHFVGHGGDYYFKDWHATREHGNGLLLQKAAHDIDVMHWLADSHTVRVSAMGALTVYDKVSDRRDRSNELMGDWFSLENWPPLSQTGLNPVIDVEDLSMMMMRLDSGVYASYEQCHFSPDYWRNYTVIGTEGRIENFGDSEGGVIKLWNKRHDYDPQGDAQFPIVGDAAGHGDADVLTVSEFVRFVRDDEPTDTSPLGAWYAVAAAIQATESLRDDSTPRDIPELPDDLISYFNNNQSNNNQEES
ncbi:Predicted dehydrogenase [Tessaracoccus bendigoensis DSM 12906]|uniref:Predicted dehydrogenase n=1 Tax=Tessaracoccus bendigoensis DSM 12906 TaxID=1123357 RepID=A0A1M6J0J5_9ACTN|nr:ROK family protein [Tessaracoccus bendigoensis]SHJ40159.1 Predicted dehydrogenase [Tessaracoccus bendigoensis DSM 12906]